MSYTVTTTPANGTGVIRREVTHAAERVLLSGRYNGSIFFKLSPGGPAFRFQTASAGVNLSIRRLALHIHGVPPGTDPNPTHPFGNEDKTARKRRAVTLARAREYVPLNDVVCHTSYTVVRWIINMVESSLETISYNATRNRARFSQTSPTDRIVTTHRLLANSPRLSDYVNSVQTLNEAAYHNRKARNQRLARLIGELHREGGVADRDLLRETLDSIGWSASDAPSVVTDHLIMATCGHWEWRSDVEGGTNDVTCCSDCYGDSEYIYPEDDEYRLYHRDDLYYSDARGVYLTYDDTEEDDDDDQDCNTLCVYDWGTNALNVLNGPEIESKPDGDFTIGMEFECEPDDFDSRRKLARHINNSAQGRIMCKNDGSLSDRGIELVFAPMTLESTKDAWRKVEFPSGTTAWNAGCCGMHVHIDSQAFTRLSLAKFVTFWNRSGNAALIRLVAGRHPSEDRQACQYAATFDLDPTSVVRSLKKSGISEHRYRCVNLTTLSRATCERLGVHYEARGHHQSYNTVELRIFRASLKPERTLAQVEMVHATVEFARQGSAAGMTEPAFREWLKRNGSRYPNLRTWLGITRAHKLAKSGVPFTEAEAA